MWFEMLRVIAECRPSFVLAENVRGAVNLALDTVQAGMEDEGYAVRTLLLPAAAFGAPHKRERMFVIGVREDVADRLCLGSEAGIPRQNARKEGESNLSDYIGEGGGSLWPTPTVGTSGGGKLCGGTGYLNMLRDALGYEEARKLSAGNGGSLNPEWVEILMGFPLGWTDIYCDEPEPWPGWGALMGQSQHPYEPPRTVTGCPNRAKRLKCLGNAVVPQQAVPIFEAIRQIHNHITCECFT